MNNQGPSVRLLERGIAKTTPGKYEANFEVSGRPETMRDDAPAGLRVTATSTKERMEEVAYVTRDG
jgi:hypothetical protein